MSCTFWTLAKDDMLTRLIISHGARDTVNKTLRTTQSCKERDGSPTWSCLVDSYTATFCKIFIKRKDIMSKCQKTTKEKSHAVARRMRYMPFAPKSHLETILRHNFTFPSHRRVWGFFFLLLVSVGVGAICVLWRASDLDSNIHLTQNTI